MSAQAVLDMTWRQLFPGEATEIKARYRKLVRDWHPDVNKDPKSAEVIQHITQAYDRAMTGPKLPNVKFELNTDKFLQFDYLSVHSWEAGDVFTTQSAVVYRVPPELRDLAFLAEKYKWTFNNKLMENSLSPLLPKPVRFAETKTQGTLMIYRRQRDWILLQDLLLEEAVDPIHVMWFVSSLLNLCAYMSSQGTTHFGLHPLNLLVNPATHEIALTGPELYAIGFNDAPKAVPSEILAQWPNIRKKVPRYIADVAAVRRIVMKILGIGNVAVLRNRTDLHEGLKKWLMMPPLANGIEEYATWEKLRGARRFTPYNLTAQQVYDLG